MQQGKAKIRLLAGATLGMARLLFLGGLVLLLNFAMIRLAISVCDARDNTRRASFGLKSKAFEYFHTGIYPFSGSAFINADRFSPKSFEISPAPLDPSNDLSQALTRRLQRLNPLWRRKAWWKRKIMDRPSLAPRFASILCFYS